MSSERKHKTQIVAAGGNVLQTLLNDEFIQMTPTQARAIGARLITTAAEAEGKPAPEMVILTKELA